MHHSFLSFWLSIHKVNTHIQRRRISFPLRFHRHIFPCTKARSPFLFLLHFLSSLLFFHHHPFPIICNRRSWQRGTISLQINIFLRHLTPLTFTHFPLLYHFSPLCPSFSLFMLHHRCIPHPYTKLPLYLISRLDLKNWKSLIKFCNLVWGSSKPNLDGGKRWHDFMNEKKAGNWTRCLLMKLSSNSPPSPSFCSNLHSLH